jgi:XRE family transcriptional regulator, regulator of sulfur utilization
VSEAARNLASSLRQLRSLRGQSQAQLAKSSGVPRATIASLESGSANPTLNVLVKLADALKITVEELIAPPLASNRLYASDEIAVRHPGRGVTVRALLPDNLPGAVVERMEFAPNTHMKGNPHKPGTREYLTCESGIIRLTAAAATTEVHPGEVLVFRGDQHHGYSNGADGATVAYSVVLVTSQ